VHLIQEADVDTMLTEELVQFQLPAANPISILTSQLQGFSPACPPRLHCHTWLLIELLFLGQLLDELSLLGGRIPLREKELVNSMQASVGRFSRRSAIPSRGG
jgi:hypothetical protein